MNRRDRRARGGFTLLELVVSLALATALLATLGGVLLGVTRQVEAIDSLPSGRPAWADLLAGDLRDATSYELAEPSSLRLFGPVGRGAQSGLRTHSMGGVSYLVRELGGEQWLCRVVTPSSEGRQVLGLLCRGRELGLSLHGVPAAGAGAPAPLPEAGELPDALTVVLTHQPGPDGDSRQRRVALVRRTIWRRPGLPPPADANPAPATQQPLAPGP